MNVMIILNYNDSTTTKEYLEKIKEYRSVDKIIVVDNASSDNSYNLLLPFQSDKIDVIRNEINSGYGQGNNYGIKFAEERYQIDKLIISNPDIIVADESIGKMLQQIEPSRGIVSTSGLIYDKQLKVSRVFAWKVPRYGTLLADTVVFLPRLLSHTFGYSMFYNKQQFQNQVIKDVEVLSGCFFCIDYLAFKEIGFYDSGTFLYGEENIIGYQLKEKGYRQRLLLEEQVIHTQNNSIAQDIKKIDQKNNYLLQTNSYFITKYLKKGQLKNWVYKTCFTIGKYEKKLVLYILGKIRK